jgi:uncharacterized protein (DUF1684 family)
MAGRIKTIFPLMIGVLFLWGGIPLCGEKVDQDFVTLQEKQVMEWRKERDAFFKNHERSPLTSREKRNFKGLKYYPFNSQYAFSGKIERYILHINNPKYYATIEVYKSILSDTLFIPFKDKTNGKETYEGGRYIDAEILRGYRMDLDFNMAYHPSCAYNEKFICVLTPRENMLEIEIKAGEKNLK